MSVALYIAIEDESEVGDTFVNGKAVGQHEPALARMAKQLGVTPIMEFYGNAAEDMMDMLGEDDLDGAEVEMPDGTGPAWFDPAAGLNTIRALIQNIEKNPSAIKQADAILSDLREYITLLVRVQNAGTRFCFGVDG